MSHGLNPQQRAAVDSSACDLFVSAGAGSGKTRVLMEAYVDWVRRSGRDALDSVLTITFTEKAAGEIAERVRAALAADPDTLGISREIDSAWISTIHGMCSRLLRRHALEAGIDPQFSVGSEVQLGVLKQEAFEEVATKAIESGGPAAEYIEAVGQAAAYESLDDVSERLRSLGVTPEQVERVAPRAGWLETAREELGGVLGGFQGIPNRTATIEASLSTLRDVLDTLDGFVRGELDAHDLAAAAGEAKLRKTGSQEVKELAEAGEGILALVCENAMQVAVAPYEVAFLELVERYQSAYASRKQALDLLDFEDLQIKVIELLETHPHLAARYARTFKAIMIDEFQDTNALQVRLIDALAPNGFITVGDEKQSIYRFRHADVDLFRSKQSRSSEVLPLSFNYRSHPALLGFFNDLFSRPPFWSQDYLELQAGRSCEPADPGDPGVCDTLLGPRRVTALIIDTNSCGQDKHADEAAVIARHVRELVDAGREQKDIVVLMRTMTHADTYADALRQVGLEAFVASGGTYFDRPEVLDLEMLLRVIVNPLDDEAMAHVLAGPVTALSADAIGALRMRADHDPLWTAITADPRPELDTADQERLTAFVTALEWARAHRGIRGVADLIHEVCERVDYDLTLFARGFEGARAWANVLKLARIAEEFEAEEPGDPQAFLEHLRLKREHEGRESLAAFAAENVDAVRIMTVHASKGLQFPITIAATLGHSYFPTPAVMLGVAGGRATLGMKLPVVGSSGQLTLGYRKVLEAEKAADIEESKRVFYVACTRAEDALVLCGRSDLTKEPEADRPIGWLREVLESGDSVSDDPELRRVGDSLVRVVYAEPQECELKGVPRPAADPATLARTRASQSTCRVPDPATLERVSYSGLARYRACPYRFYATSVARLGSLATREPAAESPTAFGTAVHAVLSIVRDGFMPDRARIDEICASAELGPDRWSTVADVVASFLTSEAAALAASCERHGRELPFALPVGEVLLDGVIDFIGWRSPDEALVLDYKTGHTDERYDPTESYTAQADCYALAAHAMGASDVRVVFVELENGSRMREFSFGPREIQDARTGIERTVASIVAGEYPHLAGYDALVCDECPALGNLCPISAPPRRAV